ncbi:MAG: PQQ-dependent sugar dehydrogenase [Anaerolineae bacterium]|nr:PQQ-dependent sugar dehydrogenase [Anaerolineae bacterium]
MRSGFSLAMFFLLLSLPFTTAAQFPAIDLEPYVTVPNRITYLTHAGDERLFLVEKEGRVLIVENQQVLDSPFLDISDRVLSSGSEQGLLSIAFDPNYAENGEFYVNYTDQAGDGDTVISRFRVTDDPNVADPVSEEIILTIDQPARNHNGGQIKFGPDGYLYVGTGDGGRGGDPWDNAENLSVLLGKMLRLKVTGEATYAVPADNPYAEIDLYRPELWSYGLRNPWRFSFDRETGDLYIADVGQGNYEEVNFQYADSSGGENYGWNTSEGLHCYSASNCDMTAVTLPVVEYDHSLGCSVTGGYVYRGTAFPSLNGIYFFGDYCSGIIWGMTEADTSRPQVERLLQTTVSIASFGEDVNGELYVLDLSGAVYRLVVR